MNIFLASISDEMLEENIVFGATSRYPMANRPVISPRRKKPFE